MQCNSFHLFFQFPNQNIANGNDSRHAHAKFSFVNKKHIAWIEQMNSAHVANIGAVPIGQSQTNANYKEYRHKGMQVNKDIILSLLRE